MRTSILVALFFLLVSVSLAQEKRAGFGILIDNTGSLRPDLPREIELAKEIIKQIGERGTVSVYGFATDPVESKARFALGVECTSGSEDLYQQLDRISAVGGQTTLIDAIKAAAERLGPNRPAKCSESTEKTLILITDGEDRASSTKEKDLVAALKENSTKILAVGLLDGLSKESGFVNKSPRDKGKDFLEKITKETGGKVVFPKKKQTVAEIVTQLFEQPTVKTK